MQEKPDNESSQSPEPDSDESQDCHDQARRHFMKAGLGLFAGGAVLGIGATKTVCDFCFGPRLTPERYDKLAAERVKRLEQTLEQKKYELEREQKDSIFVSRLDGLSAEEGKYFIDFQMSPGLAFLDTDGFPLLISAKCTHLGCTVGNKVDARGKILCPCHISYFDIKTGYPNPGSPAKAPLPHIPWAVMSETGKLLAQKGEDGVLQGQAGPELLKSSSVFIIKHPKEKV